jgi:hypothetical protein
LKAVRIVLLAVLVLATLVGGLYWKFSEQLPIYWFCSGQAQQSVISPEGKILERYSGITRLMLFERWGDTFYAFTDSAFTGKYRLCVEPASPTSKDQPLLFGSPNCNYPNPVDFGGYSRQGELNLATREMHLAETRIIPGRKFLTQAYLHCSVGDHTFGVVELIGETP